MSLPNHVLAGVCAATVVGILWGMLVTLDTSRINNVRRLKDVCVFGCYAAIWYAALLMVPGMGLAVIGWLVSTRAPLDPTFGISTVVYTMILTTIVAFNSLVTWRFHEILSVPTHIAIRRMYLLRLKNPTELAQMLIMLIVSLLIGIGIALVLGLALCRTLWFAFGFVMTVVAGGSIASVYWYKRHLSNGSREAFREHTGLNRDIGNQVILLGMDALDWKVLSRLWNAGELPNFSYLFKHGTCCRQFRTLKPTWSTTLWTSISTGKLPHKHGVNAFVAYLLPGMRAQIVPRTEPTYFGGTSYFLRQLHERGLIKVIPVTSACRKCPAIWNILSLGNRRVGVLGWLASWPAEAVNGFVVSDHTVHIHDKPLLGVTYVKTDHTYPPTFYPHIYPLIREPDSLTKEEIRRFMKLNDEEIKEFYALQKPRMGYDPLPWFKMTYPQDASYVAVANYLLDHEQLDFLAVYFQGIDVMSHCTMKYMFEDGADVENARRFGATLEAYYRYYDGIVGEFLGEMGDDTMLLVVSDHGFEGSDGLYGHLNAPPGVLFAFGKHVRAGCEIVDASVLDVTPTVLHFLGLPVGQDMDGSVLSELFEQAFLKADPIRYIESYDFLHTQGIGGHNGEGLTPTDVDDVIIERLKGLGYLD